MVAGLQSSEGSTGHRRPDFKMQPPYGRHVCVGSQQGDVVPPHRDLSIELGGCPHDMEADFVYVFQFP